MLNSDTLKDLELIISLTPQKVITHLNTIKYAFISVGIDNKTSVIT